VIATGQHADPLSVTEIATFSAVGVSILFQDLTARVFELMPKSDSLRVAEESLSMLAVVTARAIDEGGGGSSVVAQAVNAILNLPYAFRDYSLGSEMLNSELDMKDAGTRSGLIGERLQKTLGFYETQIPAGISLTDVRLGDNLLLWMGRISPRGLESSPDTRLDDSGVREMVSRHVRLISAYTRHHIE
jgi:hypothetical protein